MKISSPILSILQPKSSNFVSVLSFSFFSRAILVPNFLSSFLSFLPFSSFPR